MARINQAQTIKVGARGSALSRVQAQSVIDSLRKLHPKTKFEFIAITTSGDNPERPPDLGAVKGLFVKEIETALLEKRIDLAVHSAKDLATDLPDGLTLGPAIERASPFDVMISAANVPIDRLHHGAVIGTSSLRRQTFLKAYRKSLAFEPLRGNVETRIKAVGNPFSAVVVAKAALERLKLEKAYRYETLSEDILPPAPGQGQLALEYRVEDQYLASLLLPLDHTPSALALNAERAFTRELGLGCTAPVAALCTLNEANILTMSAALVHKNQVIREEQTARLSDLNISYDMTTLSGMPQFASKLGQDVARKLLAKAPKTFMAYLAYLKDKQL